MLHKICICLLVLFVSCRGVKEVGEDKVTLPEPKLPEVFLPVPLRSQKTSYTCGVASLTAAYLYWQVYQGEEEGLYKELGTSPKGTDSPPMLKSAKQRGLEAYEQEGLSIEDLKRFLSQGKTVLLSYQAWSELPPPVDYRKVTKDGHWSVLVAMDSHYLYLMDPSVEGAYGYVSQSDFMNRWHDGGESRAAIVLNGKNPLRPKAVVPLRPIQPIH